MYDKNVVRCMSIITLTICLQKQRLHRGEAECAKIVAQKAFVSVPESVIKNSRHSIPRVVRLGGEHLGSYLGAE